MAFGFPGEIVIYDTEYTAWEGSQARGWTGPNEHREIIEIGAIMVDTNSFIETSSLDLYIKPRINPELSAFIMDLTKIPQDRIDAGDDFAVAWRTFNVWRGDRHAYAFGRDELVIKENCELCGIPYEYEGRFHNIRELFDVHGVVTANYYSSTIPSAFGIAPTGDAHNGLSDARNILIALRALAERQ